MTRLVARYPGSPVSRRLTAVLVALAAAACGGDNPQSNGSPEEPAAVGCHDGTLAATGALYRVCYPSGWNGDLVLYAHGYVAADAPLAVPDDHIDGQSVAQVVNGLGYAYATTSYRANGLVADEAVEDVAQLVSEVRRRFTPDPSRSFVVGVSEGGLVAALAAERHPDLFNGAVAACGPVGDFAGQIDYLGDFRVLFDYFFPGVIPGGPVDVPDTVRAQWNAVFAPKVSAALQADDQATLQLLTVSGAPHDAADLQFATTTALDILWYDVFALPDARQRLGGQPYDNIGRVYQGSSDDAALNAGVARVAADAAARTALDAFETSGALTVPVSTLHTTGDPVIPVAQESGYAGKVTAHGAASFLSQLTPDRYGHCSFTGAEVLQAFAAVTARAAAVRRID
ncbi:MAG TPA: prolyl oligopeptidase family serine peptidase [Gemmatimonadales bacterium]|nr:prolyl oligopeptidase family serine peptidase [Gemmatimonadales bacterium]